MPRVYGTNVRGGGFSTAEIEAVWQKAYFVAGYSGDQVRKDQCGMFIVRDQYGDVSEFGWEIDHAIPVAHDGSDVFTNLQPLHWRNNRGKGDDFPRWTCSIQAAV